MCIISPQIRTRKEGLIKGGEEAREQRERGGGSEQQPYVKQAIDLARRACNFLGCET